MGATDTKSECEEAGRFLGDILEETSGGGAVVVASCLELSEEIAEIQGMIENEEYGQ